MGDLDIYEFGRQLIKTKDLDPVYVLVWEAGLDPAKLRRWLLAYWCFYHVGTASWITDQKSYWKAMETAAGSKDYPRCPERRHFRGENAAKSVTYLSQASLVNLFAPLYKEQSATDVMETVQRWVGFGPWISFKVADMAERLGLARIKFGMSEVLYESPMEGAKLLYSREINPVATPPADVGTWAIESILNRLGRLKAPPRYERCINVQEAETVLCKWKSYVGGRYHVGEDIESCKKGLLRFPETPTSRGLLEAGERSGLWG